MKPAHAYADPGSGLFLFQIGGSMLAGAMFVMRAKLRKLLSFGAKSKVSAAMNTKDTPRV